MNYSYYNSVDPPTRPIYIYNDCSLTELGIFISSILLSGGAFFSQIIATLQKSKCSTISCLGSKCIREVDSNTF
jgi:hypothetical protein